MQTQKKIFAWKNCAEAEHRKKKIKENSCMDLWIGIFPSFGPVGRLKQAVLHVRENMMVKAVAVVAAAAAGCFGHL